MWPRSRVAELRPLSGQTIARHSSRARTCGQCSAARLLFWTVQRTRTVHTCRNLNPDLAVSPHHNVTSPSHAAAPGTSHIFFIFVFFWPLMSCTCTQSSMARVRAAFLMSERGVSPSREHTETLSVVLHKYEFLVPTVWALAGGVTWPV